MKVATYEATVENGQIKLMDSIELPEHTRVIVVVPDVRDERWLRVMSPRLVPPEQAADLEKELLAE